MAKNKRIQDLYFGVLLPQIDGKGDLAMGNLFDCSRIRYWAAMYRSKVAEGRFDDNDPIFYIFGDVWSRSEFEFIVSPFLAEEPSIKLSLYEMYVVPNRIKLLNMINECSGNSAKEYIREFKNLHKPTK